MILEPCVTPGSLGNKIGKRWKRISGRLKQIDSGKWGIVWGVSVSHTIYCRTGITWRKPRGTGWRRVKGRLKYVSLGGYGCWGVNRLNNIFFRVGVSPKSPQGRKFYISFK